MPVHILAGATVLGLAVAGTAETVAWWQARVERAAILARITPPVQADIEAAMALFAAEAAARIAERGLRLDMTTDHHGTVHYRTVPRYSAERTASIVHLVDTQPLQALSATRPMLPAVKGKLQRARFYDIGRAG